MIGDANLRRGIVYLCAKCAPVKQEKNEIPEFMRKIFGGGK